MAKKDQGPKRDMMDIAQALADCGDELHNVSMALSATTSEEYLVQELAIMVGVRVKLAYNIRKLKKLTGQEDPLVKDLPF